MANSQQRSLGYFAILTSCLLASTPTFAAEKYERPPTFSVAKMRGLAANGANYTIKDPIRSDGLLRIYILATPYGEFPAHGDGMLRMRINELQVLAALERVSGSQAFSDALVRAGLSPLKYTGKLITQPVGTVRDTLAGVGALFGRIGSGIGNLGKTPDDPLSGILGVSDQRREIAAHFGVDPYTDLSPLDARLRQLSEAAAAGGLVVTGAMFAIPGAAGVVVSNLSTANKLGDIGIAELARNYTAAQIFDLSRQRMLTMGVEPQLAEALIVNRNYTPIDMAALVAALDSMRDVQERREFIVRAASVQTRAIAYFMRRHADMLADHQARTREFARFVTLGGYPFNLTRDGRVIGIMPVDILSWAQSTAQAFGDSTADMRRIAPRAKAELRITGQATKLAMQRLKQLGWSVTENVRP